MRKKGSGRTKGAVSFLAVNLGELNRVLKEGAIVIVSRRYAEQLGLEGKPMTGNAKNIADASKQIDLTVDNDNVEVNVSVEDW
jgi:hypothetical protein